MGSLGLFHRMGLLRKEQPKRSTHTSRDGSAVGNKGADSWGSRWAMTRRSALNIRYLQFTLRRRPSRMATNELNCLGVRASIWEKLGTELTVERIILHDQWPELGICDRDIAATNAARRIPCRRIYRRRQSHRGRDLAAIGEQRRVIVAIDERADCSKA